MSKTNKIWLLLGILLTTILSYWSALDHPFTFLDDQQQVVQNPNIRSLSLSSLKAIFSSTSVGMYQPITTLIYALIFSIAELEPFAYHFTSLLFHLANCLLVFFFLKEFKIKLWPAVILTGLFALHPMQVESVAWVSAFSNLVFSFFYLLALISYMRFKEQAGLKFLYLSLAFFIFSCFSKASAVSLPLVLLAIDLYHDKGIKLKSVLQKLPFFIIALIFSIITIQSREAAGHLSDLSLTFDWFDRIFLISYSILFYPWQFIDPIKLSAFYPYPELNDALLPLAFYLAFPMLLFLIWLLYRFRKQSKLYLGALIFFFILAPTLHFIPVGNQLSTDRYLYLPMIGLLLMISIGLDRIPKKGLKIAWLSALILLAILSYHRADVWKNDRAIWTDVISKYPKVAQAYNNLGSYQLLEGKKQAAFKNFDKAIQLKPYYADAYNNRGNLLSQAGKSEAAINDFNKALELRPHADAYFNRANEFTKRGDFRIAIEDYSESLKLKQVPDAFTNRAFAYLQIDQDQAAVADLKAAIALDPSYHQAYFLLAMEARKRVDFEAACKYLQLAAKYGNKKAAAGYRELCS